MIDLGLGRLRYSPNSSAKSLDDQEIAFVFKDDAAENYMEWKRKCNTIGIHTGGAIVDAAAGRGW